LFKWSVPRLRADRLVKRAARGSEVEETYRQALELARHHDARFEQLQSTRHIARWLKSQGHAAEARATLSEIYNRFTEGSDTLVLQEAKVLLDELNAQARSCSC
jgi:ATP/maltotriose-dependent transcriptional regulator MalT